MSEIISRNTCSTCAWKVGHGEGASFCRRNPPQVIVRMALNSRTKLPEEVVASMFPMVKPDMWCGEYAGIVRHIEDTEGISGMLAGRPGNGRS